MAPSKELTTVAPTESPYKLDKDQVIKASRALLAHVKAEELRKNSQAEKKDLLKGYDASDDGESDLAEVPIWLVLTTKRHIIDKKRLKPSKISIPHPLNTSPTSTICLITADPQRIFKDTIAHPSFPSELSSCITRVISISKLHSKYKPFENKRQLFSEHDIFLADDRIITLLPKILGKAFYKSGAKRPIPISIAAEDDRKDRRGKKPDQKKSLTGKEIIHSVASPKRLADEITKALSIALVHLSPSTCTSVRVGKANWDENQVTENVEAVVNGLVTKLVPKGWRGVRSIHIKGPESAALPVWLADELWMDAEDVLEDKPVDGEAKAIEAGKEDLKRSGKKRKVAENEGEDGKSPKKVKKDKKVVNGEPPSKPGKEAALQKEKLKKKKVEAQKDMEEAEQKVMTVKIGRKPSGKEAPFKEKASKVHKS